MSHAERYHIDHCCDRHAMNTWVGLILYWRPKVILSAAVAIGVVLLDETDQLGFRDMAVPRHLFVHGMLWLILFEFAARLYRAGRDSWGGPLGDVAGVVLSAVLEAIGLYFAYAVVLGMTTVMVRMTAGTGAAVVMEGLNLFFVVAIAATQLVMALVHLHGSREAAKAWVRGLRRNWTWMQEITDRSPSDNTASDP